MSAASFVAWLILEGFAHPDFADARREDVKALRARRITPDALAARVGGALTDVPASTMRSFVRAYVGSGQMHADAAELATTSDPWERYAALAPRFAERHRRWVADVELRGTSRERWIERWQDWLPQHLGLHIEPIGFRYDEARERFRYPRESITYELAVVPSSATFAIALAIHDKKRRFKDIVETLCDASGHALGWPQHPDAGLHEIAAAITDAMLALMLLKRASTPAIADDLAGTPLGDAISAARR